MGVADPDVAIEGAVDCHAHVFRVDLPMAAGARYRPQSDASAADYTKLLDDNRIAGAVLVQVSFLGADNTYLRHSLAGAPARFRGVAIVENTVSAEVLASYKEEGIVGVRFNLLGLDVPDFASSTWQTHLRTVGDARMHIELQAEGVALARAIGALRHYGIPVVIDHFGRPADVDEDPGFAAVLDAAPEPHIWIKLSAPYRFRADPRLAAGRLIAVAGHQRLVWGSDWPWTQHPQVDDYSAQKAALSNWLGEDEGLVQSVLERNPRRLYWR